MAEASVRKENQSEAHIRKVLFADVATVKFSSVIQALKKESIVVEAVNEGPKFLSMLSEESFDVCVLNLVFGGVGPFELLSNVRKVSKNRDIRVIVTSKQVQKLNIQNSIKAGANDFVAEPFDLENLFERIIYHLTPKQILEPRGYEGSEASAKSWPFINILLQATEMFSHTQRGQDHSTFYKTLSEIAVLLESNRSSLIIVDAETSSGVVLASSDDPKFADFPISLNKYPEIQHVMYSGNFVFVEDVTQNTLTEKINESVKSISIGSLMVFPVRYNDDVTGVLTVRRAAAAQLPPMDVMRVLQAIANTMAAHSNTRALLRRIYRDYNPAPAKGEPSDQK